MTRTGLLKAFRIFSNYEIKLEPNGVTLEADKYLHMLKL